jgi:hypothetical protein
MIQSFQIACEDELEFRLTYAGPLYATQRDPNPGKPPRHTQNRHDIRRAMHLQLRRLWVELPALNGSSSAPNVLVLSDRGRESFRTTANDLAAYHAMYGFNFVPLVTKQLDLVCSLDILFLRPDRPGDLVWGGDIDNRLKTFLDALRIPEAGEGYVNRTPQADEKPMYCLLEDDKLITRVSVETDRLLEPVNGAYSAENARLVVTVRIRPYELHTSNMHLG